MNEEYHSLTNSVNKSWGNIANTTTNAVMKAESTVKNGLSSIGGTLEGAASSALSGVETTLLVAGLGIAALLYWGGHEAVKYGPTVAGYAKEGAKTAAEMAPLLLV